MIRSKQFIYMDLILWLADCNEGTPEIWVIDFGLHIQHSLTKRRNSIQADGVLIIEIFHQFLGFLIRDTPHAHKDILSSSQYESTA